MRLSRLVWLTAASALLAAAATMGTSGATAAPVEGSLASALAWTAVQQGHVRGDSGSQQFFGEAVAVSGDTAVVGMPYENDYSGKGAAYVFVRSGGIWTYQATLRAAAGENFDWFGYSVALDGDTAVIGARRDDVGGIYDQGAAYVFVRSGTSWSQEATLTAVDGVEDDQLGSAVALSGDTALVGGVGSAYVFTRSGTSWTQQTELVRTDGDTGGWFGYAVALDGDTALIGDFHRAVSGATDQGAAYVFTRSGTAWSEQARLLAGDGAVGDEFGISVALSGDTALVGAYTDDVDGSINQGSAYVFARSGTSWGQQAQLKASDGSAYDCFGASVSLSGTTALLGAYGDGGAGTPSNAYGSAYVFTRSSTSWSQQLKLMADDAESGDWFGDAVALDGDTALVGAPHDVVSSIIEQGSAYAFVLNSTQPTAIALTSGSNSALAYGGAFAVKGTLTSGGAGLVGRTVILQAAAPGAAYKDTSLSAVTGTGGAFTFWVKPTTTTYYRARFAGATGLAASGPTASVYAKPKVSLARTTSWSTLYRSKTYYAKGYIKPRHATSDANKVRIRAYKKGSDGKYHYVKSFTASYSYYSSTKTRYKAAVKLTSRGSWKLVAYHATDSKNAKTYGSADYVRVK